MNEFLSNLPTAAGYTILLTTASFAIGAVLALPIMLARISDNKILSTLARLLLDVIRGIPPLVWLFILYFGISLGAVQLGPLESAIAALGIISSAYLAEVYRGGYTGVSAGQFEAAEALGLTRRQVATRVIAPQAIRVALPGTATYAIGLLKDSSVASLVGVMDIVFITSAAGRTSGVLLPFSIAALSYLALSAPLAVLARVLDHRLRARVAR
jgi:polar amino acid transport system permease protein